MTRQRTIVPPGNWLGLLGGGQLGRMFAMAAQSLGYRVACLDPARDGPAASVCDEHFEADYLDAPALENLALQCAAVTTEFENVPAQSLAFLAEHCFTTPSAESVAVAQDRIAEKRFLASCGIAVVPHAVIEEAGDFAAVGDDLFPAILKTSRMGYDGKGQARVANRAEAIEAFATLGANRSHASAILEKRLALAFEASVIVARGADGKTAVYAPAENIHRVGILAVSTVPSPHVTPALEGDLVAAALRVAHALDYVGVLCVEFFVVDDAGSSRIYANEIAPRPHNSGHYTIDACVTSQFAQQARIAAGLPLGDPRRHGAAVMLNLLGDLWFVEPAPDQPTIVAAPPEASGDLHGAALGAQAIDLQATADVDRLLANAEAAIEEGAVDAEPGDPAGDAADGGIDETIDAPDGDGDAVATLDRTGDGAGDDASPHAGDAGDEKIGTSPKPPRQPPPRSGDGASAANAASDRSDGVNAHQDGDRREPDWAAVLSHPGVALHLYGKREARRRRKMGHVTIVAETPDEARRIALEVARTLGIDAW